MAFDAFRGVVPTRMDSKARVSIPSAFRDTLDSGMGGGMAGSHGRTRVVLVYGDPRRPFVAGYSLQGMDQLVDEIRTLPRGSRERRALERHMIALSTTVEIDDDGRVVLPMPVREKLGLTNGPAEVVFAGALDFFELWGKDTYDAEMAERDRIESDLLEEEDDILTLLSRGKPEA